MRRARLHILYIFTSLLSALFLSTAPQAQAGEYLTDSTTVAQGTGTLVTIAGIPAESFLITYVDAGGVTRTKTVTTVRHPFSAIGQVFTTVPAAKGTAITVTNLTQPREPAQNLIAARFTPSDEAAVTALAMNPASTLNAFGQTFTIGGGFTTVATMADYDATSPTYGILSGNIPSSFFDVFATLGGDQIIFNLDGGATPFQLNVASTWDADMPDTGLVVPFMLALSGSLTYLGTTSPFTGSITGDAVFFPDNFETITANITLDGIGSGVFSASGQTALVPEPTSLLLVGIAIAGLAAAPRRAVVKAIA